MRIAVLRREGGNRQVAALNWQEDIFERRQLETSAYLYWTSPDFRTRSMKKLFLLLLLVIPALLPAQDTARYKPQINYKQ